MKKCLLLLGLLPAVFIFAQAAQPEQPTLTAEDLPRFPAVEPKDSIKSIQVKAGFHVELAASEPNVASPIALCFDERGRMFVVEMIDYSERREEKPHLGRIRMLEDTDGDGVYDKSSVYADDLPWPTALFYYNGGIFVVATPDLLYLKDTKGTGKADHREVIATGFAAGVPRVNMQGLANNLIWGLDNRIHGATSGNGGTLKDQKHPQAKPLDLHGRDFVIEPRSLTYTSEAGGGQHGLSFDDFGHRFACNNSDHIRLWEVAGTSHDDAYGLVVGPNDAGKGALDTTYLPPQTSVFGVITCDKPINAGPQHYVASAAIARLNRWVRNGRARGPSAPRLQITPGPPPAIAHDALGNVLGGIRTAPVDAPVSILSGFGQTGGAFCAIFGTTTAFDPATLAALYPSHADYVAAVLRSTRAAVRAGFLLGPDAKAIKAAAIASDVGQ
jgi:hypothetical protein